MADARRAGTDETLTVGKRLSHYEVLDRLGEGGMGVLYRARDTRLDRTVALKLLRPEAATDLERRWRLVQEAKAASALNHPNIVTIYDIERAAGPGEASFIAMELVQGDSLLRLMTQRRLSVEEALAFAIQIASALAAAHAAGIVHRDIKPGNVMVTASGHVKVLDFGLAKLREHAPAQDPSAPTTPTVTRGPGTAEGVVLGTPAYMSPEQAEGRSVDARSDVFSFGALLYETLAGRRAFQGDSTLAVLSAILRGEPPALHVLRPEVPRDLEQVVARCLEKDRDARYASGEALLRDLSACQARLQAAQAGMRALLRRPQVVLPGLLVVLALLGGSAWWWRQSSRLRWARQTALPEMARLVETEDFVAAFRLAREAQPYLRDDPQFQRLWRDMSSPESIHSEPPGAEVSVKAYSSPESPWEPLGRTPLEEVRVPAGHLRWKVSREGFEPIEGAFFASVPVFSLARSGEGPPGMVRVPGGRYEYRNLGAVELQEYWLDRFEVTHRKFKEFVDQGGYRKPEHWKHPFIKRGRRLSWEEAMAEFRDATGRPGPSTWELGSYPEGKGDFPVSGVSWYEAAAYAEFVGRSLPTLHHWYKASIGNALRSEILLFSNFSGEGPSRVGSHPGLSPWGAYDMAGNVREWSWNGVGDRRYILGGAWSDPIYLFTGPDALDPFDRSATNGFRCAKYVSPPSEAAFRPIEARREAPLATPVSDEVFEAYRSLYAYDRTELGVKLEGVDDRSEHWRKEKVSFGAAYGGERMWAYLFLPKDVPPPYQTVVYFPTSSARILRSSEDLETRQFGFIVRSGRAVLFPVYKDTYERRLTSLGGPRGRRDLMIQWSKDLGRSLDYAETRPDVDRGRLAYYGNSLGAWVAPILTAVDPRFRAVVLVGGGLTGSPLPPEVEPVHFAPRAKAPVLMVNGLHDFLYPLETAQIPLFRLLGAPERDKRHFVYDGGHVPPRMQEVMREVLDWLDRYLGPVPGRG